MSTLWQNIQYKMLRSGNKLNLLIGINVVVYLAINMTAVIRTTCLQVLGNSALFSLFAI
jgi:hypothetical protein